MTSEENKALMRRTHEAVDRQDESAIGELVATQLLVHVAGMPDMDLAGWTQMRAVFWGAFPDLVDDIDDMVSEGDKVVGRLTL
jgi:predicted ester cyclase